MTIVVDTTVLIDHLRGVAAAREAVARALRSGERIVGSVVTRGEVFTGMRAGEEWETEQLLDLVDWLPVTLDIADRAGRIGRGFVRSHPGVDMADYIIGATTELVEGNLWTLNIKHFPMFPGLERPY